MDLDLQLDLLGREVAALRLNALRNRAWFGTRGADRRLASTDLRRHER